MAYLRPKLNRWLAVGAAAVLLGMGSAPLLKAEGMRSDSYIIQFGNFNVTSGTKASDSFTVTDTVGQVAPGQFDSAGFTVLSGFQYLYAIPRFSFRILGLNIDLGVLSPDAFSQATNQLQVTTRSGGYTILAAADQTLRQAGGPSAPEIKHTACDNACSIAAAASWLNPGRHGFGFNVSGEHRSPDFLDGTFFRPYADREANELPQVIAGHDGVVRDDTLTVTYKAAIPSSQETGTYQTTIDYIAVPTY